MTEKLSKESRAALETELTMQFRLASESSSGLMESAAVSRRQYDGELDPKPLKWQSNVNIPTTKYMVRAAATEISQAVFGAEPIFRVEAEEPEDSPYWEGAQAEEEHLQAWNERVRLVSKGAAAVRDSLITGQAWLSALARSVKPERLPGGMPEPIRMDELDVAPDVDYVVTEDMMLIPFTAPSFRRSKGAFARKWVRWAEIMSAVKAGTMFQAAADSIKSEWVALKPTRQVHAEQGVEEAVPYDLWSASFECWEGVYRWVKPGEEVEREWFLTVWWAKDRMGPAVVLRAEDYSELYGRQWPFVAIITNPKPHSLWGESMAEDIRGLQNWTNCTFNQVSDMVTIHLLPPMAIGANSGARIRDLVWGPLEKWVLNNPTGDVQMLSGSPTALAAGGAAMNLLQFVRETQERVTNVTDISMGKPNESKRTAFEIGAVVEAGNVIREQQVSMIQLGLEEDGGLEGYARQMLQIFRKFFPKRYLAYRSSTSQPYSLMNPEMHEGTYRFVAHGSTNSSNPEVRYKKTMAIMQQALTSPFVTPSVLDMEEELIEKTQRLYRAYAEFYQALGVRSPKVWLGEEPKTIEDALQLVAAANPQLGVTLARKFAPGAGAGAGSVPAEAEEFGAGGDGGGPSGPQAAGVGGLPTPVGGPGMGPA